MGLIVFFRERGAVLTSEILSRLCRLTSDPFGRVSCRSKLLEFRVKDPPKNWSGRFFFVENEWSLVEQWSELKNLPPPLHLGEEDVLSLLKLSRMEDLQADIRYPNKFVLEENLFKAGFSTQAGRSHATALKSSAKSTINLVRKVVSKRPEPPHQGAEEPAAKKMKAVVVRPSAKSSTVVSPSPDAPSNFQVPEEVLKHSCAGLQRAMDLAARRKDLDHKRRDLEDKLSESLKEWNTEFVSTKYHLSEYKRRYKAKVKEVADLESQLAGCRSELATLMSSFSSRNQEIDRARDETTDALAEVAHLKKGLKTQEAKVKTLEAEVCRLSAALTEKEIEADGRAVEDFRTSAEFKEIIQEQVQKERDHIYSVEVKRLEEQCLEEGFLRGFFKTSRLVHRKMGVDIDSLSPSQISDDPLVDIDDEAASVSDSSIDVEEL